LQGELSAEASVAHDHCNKSPCGAQAVIAVMKRHHQEQYRMLRDVELMRQAERDFNQLREKE